jgi:hypothetical protein
VLIAVVEKEVTSWGTAHFMGVEAFKHGGCIKKHVNKICQCQFWVNDGSIEVKRQLYKSSHGLSARLFSFAERSRSWLQIEEL